MEHQQAKNFDMVILRDGIIPFEVFKGHKVLLAFYGNPNCEACTLRYRERAGHAHSLKDGIFLLSVFPKAFGEYNWLNHEKFMINLFDPGRKIYGLYRNDEYASTQSGQLPCCSNAADFLIDKNFIIVNTDYPVSTQLGIEEIFDFAHDEV